MKSSDTLTQNVMYALHINIIVCLSAWCNSRLHYKQCQVTALNSNISLSPV